MARLEATSPPAPGVNAEAHRAEPVRRNRGALPAHLPRVEVVVDVDDKACPCCGGGMATEALLAQVLIGKYSDHLPLYRQSQIFARQGVTLDRSTLCNWVGRACWWLAPLHELMLSTVLTSPKVFADDTTLPVLDAGRGRTKTGRLWCYAVDNRPCQLR
jgi:transposase